MKTFKDQEEAQEHYEKIVESMEKAFDQVGEALNRACDAMEKIFENSENFKHTKIIIVKKSSPGFWGWLLDKFKKKGVEYSHGLPTV